MSSKVWSIGLQKHTKMIQHHVNIRSTDQVKQVGVHEKNDRNEINSVDNVNPVFLCIFICLFFKTKELMSIFQTSPPVYFNARPASEVSLGDTSLSQFDLVSPIVENCRSYQPLNCKRKQTTKLL